MVLSTIGMAGIVFALIEGQNYGSWRQPDGSISPARSRRAAAATFKSASGSSSASASAPGRSSSVDLRLLDVRSFRFGSIAALIVALGEFGLLFTLPLLLQNALGYSALGTGWLIVSLAVGTFVISSMTPQLTTRYGGRAVVRMGLAVEAIAVAGLAVTLSASISGWLIACWLFLYGVGVGMATAQLTSVILARSPSPSPVRPPACRARSASSAPPSASPSSARVLITTLGRATTSSLEATGAPRPS